MSEIAGEWAVVVETIVRGGEGWLGGGRSEEGRGRLWVEGCVCGCGRAAGPGLISSQHVTGQRTLEDAIGRDGRCLLCFGFACLLRPKPALPSAATQARRPTLTTKTITQPL
jgi:hypothetical protein